MTEQQESKHAGQVRGGYLRSIGGARAGLSRLRDRSAQAQASRSLSCAGQRGGGHLGRAFEHGRERRASALLQRGPGVMVRTARVSPAPAALQEGGVAQPLAEPGLVPIEKNGEPSATSRFRIFIVDSGWNSAARRVLHENFALIRDLQKEDPIYVLSRERSIEFMRRHGSRIGRDPIIAVHDMQALEKSG